MKKKAENWAKVALTAVLTTALLSACGGGNQPGSGGSSNSEGDKPFQGKKLSVVTANHPWGDAIKEMIPEFEEETGMKVDVQSYFEDQLSQKLTVQFTSGSSTPDVFMYSPLQHSKQFYNNGWFQPLDEYVNRDPEFDFEDFSNASVSANEVDGHIVGIPIITEQHILYYRKDLLEEANIAVPKTMDELLAAAQQLHDPSNEIYGFAARGQRAALVSQISSFMYSEGGEFMRDGKAILNSPESIKGMNTYATLLRDYGPPGVLNMSWPQAIGVFAQGQAAFFADANSIYLNAADPEKSTIADQIGYAVFPAGDAGSQPFNIASWGIGMNAKSADKEAAWAFIEWATSKEIMLETQKLGNPGSRLSVWESPEGTVAFPQELAEVTMETQQGGVDHSLPQINAVGEARDIIGTIVQRAISGEDIEEAAEQANREFQALIDNEAGQ